MKEFRQYLRIARRWWWLIILSTLVAGSVGFVVSAILPPVYRASTTLLIKAKGSESDYYNNALGNQQLAVTYQELMTKRPVIELVAQTLALEPHEIAQQIRVSRLPNTPLIEVIAETNDPSLAMALANETVAAFLKISRESGAVKTGTLIVVEPATQPLKPISPQKLRIILLVAMLGFLLAMSVIFLFEHLDDSLESVEDIHHSLMLPILTIVPLPRRGRKRGRRSLIDDDPNSLLAEAYRVLRTSLQFSHPPHGDLHTLMITTPLSLKEKGDIVSNLGIVMAQAGLKVLLVDADLRQPRLHQIFELAQEPGLSTWLTETDNCYPYIFETHISNLQLLCSGSIPSDPLKLLSSPRMTQIIDKLKTEADIVLLNTPPLLTAADSVVLATQVDGAILVIESQSTRRQPAAQALKMLRNVEAEVLGVVLTGAPIRLSGYRYYSDFSKSAKSLQTLYQDHNGLVRTGETILSSSKSVSKLFNSSDGF